MKKGKERYDVFISYRREDGWESAKHLRDILVGKGYSVFFDIDSLKNGNFNDAILDYIKNCKDFIIILSPHSLDRCVNQGDWVRKELAYALEKKKNVIPVMYNKFVFPETLPEDIEGIRHINGIPVYMEAFDYVVKKIISFMESKRRIPRIMAIIAAVLAVAVLAGYFIWNHPENNGAEQPLLTASPAPVITEAPTLEPMAEPTAVPTEAPTAVPTAAQTAEPTQKPRDTSVGFIDGDYRWIGAGSTTLVEYIGNEKDIVLPKQGKKLFSSAFKDSDVESVKVPDSYQEFDFGVFVNCKKLNKVVIENENIQVNSYQELGIFIDCPNVIIYCHKDSKTYETLLKTHSGEIRFIEDEDSESTEKKDTTKESIYYEQTKHSWGDYEPKGTVTVTMKDGTVYKGAANSVVLMVKNTKWNIMQGGSENLYDGIGTPDEYGQFDDANLKPFLEIVRIQNRDNVFSTLDDEGATEDHMLPKDAQIWFISTETTYIPEKINAADVDEIAFNRGHTMDFDDLPYCTVYLDNGCFRCPAAFLLLKYNMKSNAPPAMKIAHEFTNFSNYPTKIKAIASLEVTREGTDDPYRAIQEGIGVRVTMKTGETIDFEMKGYYTFVAMSQYGRMRNLNESALCAIVFEHADAAQASVPEAAATEMPTEKKEGTRMLMSDFVSLDDKFSANEFTAFDGSIKRGEIGSVTFLDRVSGAAADAWDVSESQNGSVIAWAEKNGKLYDLYIAAEGGVIAPDDCQGLFCDYRELKSIAFNGAFHTGNTKDMTAMFCNCWHVTSLDLSGFSTENVKYMQYMFYGCSRLETLNLSSFDTSGVLNMSYMFFGNQNLKEVGLSRFSAASVWDMTHMFQGCGALETIDLSALDLSDVQYVSEMFRACDALQSIQLGKLTGDIIKTADGVFASCPKLTEISCGDTRRDWEEAGLNAQIPEGVKVRYAQDQDVFAHYEAAARLAVETMEDELDRYSRSVYVYKDDGDSVNHFTQRMLIFGNDPSLVRPMDNGWRDNPHSGDNCIRCEVVTKEGDWGGWLFLNGFLPAGGGEPQVNAADAPNQGMNLTGAYELRFWARGEKGGERVQFQTGGFQYESGAPHPDSCPAQLLWDIELEPEWTEYVIDLRDVDTSYIICGFGFALSANDGEEADNVFYLDDIRFIGDFATVHPLLRSYVSENVYLKNTAFSYDNAVAAMAFMAAGKQDDARLIVDAFVYAVGHDRYQPGLVRNAYAAGDITAIPGWGDSAILPNWYDEATGAWQENQHHTGCDTGNTSYVALALLQYHARYGGDEYLEAARQLMDWVIAECGDSTPGFTAGFDGWPENGSDTTYPLTYKSIEHNIDAYAAFARLAALTGESKYQDAADSALQFIRSQYDANHHLFYTGTLADGVTISKENTVLDAQVWACLALGDQYEPVLKTVEKMEVEPGSYSFCQSNAKGGWWPEGTAFTALMYRLRGEDEKADAALEALCAIQLDSGLFPAATVEKLSTGIYLADGTPWEYSNEPHIAPAAWFILAVEGFNPYSFH